MAKKQHPSGCCSCIAGSLFSDKVVIAQDTWQLSTYSFEVTYLKFVT